MDSRNYIWILGTILFLSGCSVSDTIISEDTITIDNDDLYLSVSPHTLSSEGWVETEFESKNYGGNIDFAFGFDTDTVKPTRAQIYNPRTLNRTISYTCDYDFVYTQNPNYFWCYSSDNSTGNITHFEHWFDSGNIPSKIAYWHENYTQLWQDWKPDNVASFDYDGLNTWYYSTNQNVNAGQRYRLRYYLEVPFSPDGTEGKYGLALKPSSKSFAQALADGQLYYLDPWWNTSYKYNYNLNITITGELASYRDPIIEVPIGNYNGSWDSLEVILDDSYPYEWEWAVHDVGTSGNATKSIRFVASNVTFTNNTLNNNFSIYLPETKISQNNDSIFYVFEDFDDGDVNGWDKDANFNFNFQADNWVNVSNSVAPKQNATFSRFEQLDNDEYYLGYKSRVDVSQIDQSYYTNLGKDYTNSMYLGISNADDYRVYDGSFTGILDDASLVNVTHSANISATGADLILNYTIREYGTLPNNTITNLGTFGTADTIDMLMLTIADQDNPAGVYLDDIYLGKIPFQLYFANTTIDTQEQLTNSPTINSANLIPATANTSYTAGFNCSTEIAQFTPENLNITLQFYKNNVLDENYITKHTNQDLSAGVGTYYATSLYDVSIADDNIIKCEINATPYTSGIPSEYATSTATLTVTGSAPATPTATPPNKKFVDVSTSQTLACPTTDTDSDTIYYEFWNDTALLSNDTNSNYVMNFTGIPPQILYWSCRASDDDGLTDWGAQNRTITVTKFTKVNDTYTTPFINFSFRDELSQANTNASITSALFNYTIGSDKISYSYSNTTASNFSHFAFAPTNETITLFASIDYKSKDYQQRHYENTWTLTSSVTNQVLYLLDTDDGSYSTYSVVNVEGVSIPDVNVLVSTTIGGVSTTVAQGKTDDSGSITFFLDPNKAHTFVFTKTGFATLTKSITPAQSSYTITLGSGGSGNYSRPYTLEGVKWVIGPQKSFLTNGQQYNFTFNVTASQNNLIACKFNITNAEGQTLANASGCDFSSGGNNGSISVLYTMNLTKVFGTYYVKMDNTSNNFTIVEGDALWTALSVNESIANTTTVKSFWWRLRNINSSSMNWGGNEQEQAWSSTAFFLIMLAVIIGLFSYFTGWEVQNPAALFLVFTFIVFMASYQGWFTLTFKTNQLFPIGNFWNQYWLFITSAMVSLAYVLNRIRRDAG